MEVKTLTPAQLAAFIATDEFKNMPVIPISTHRALSHVANPRVGPDDVIMVLAYDEGKMVGYLGVLADKIYNGTGWFKCGWLSCMWVDPTLRGKGIAKQLLSTVFTAWQNHILVTEFTPEAKGLYDRSQNFDDLKTNAGLRCFMRFNLHYVLPNRNPRFRRYTALLKAGDTLGNAVNSLRLPIIKRKSKAGLNWKQVAEIDASTADFIQQFQRASFEGRGATDLNWILKNPWIKVSESTDESERYHFSSVAKQFKNVCFTGYNGRGEIVAFLFFTLRNGHLKIPYAFFDEEYINEIVSKIYEGMFSEKADMFTVFHPALVKHFNNTSTPFIYKRTVYRNYIITKKLSANFTSRQTLQIRDGDADCAFT